MKINTKRLAELSLLIGIALIMFIVEMQIPNPFPIPGVKLGLSNIITVYAIYLYSAKEVVLIVFIRILLSSIFAGNFFAIIYSLAGSILCIFGMLVIKRIIDLKHIWISSVFGAVFHNIGQLIVAYFVFGAGIIIYLPFLIVSGCLAGMFTGVAAQIVINRLKNKGNQY